MSDQPALNTDREIWRGPSRVEFGDDDRYYADSIHVTADGGIGINCGGLVIVKPVREWFDLARRAPSEPPRSESAASEPDDDRPWIGVDLDGTLARYDGWRGEGHIGEPIEPMMARVIAWLTVGRRVKIVTARFNNGPTQVATIHDWLEKHCGKRLEVTATKDFGMIELWDDRCVQVVPNTGVPVVALCSAPASPEPTLTRDELEVIEMMLTFARGPHPEDSPLGRRVVEIHERVKAMLSASPAVREGAHDGLQRCRAAGHEPDDVGEPCPSCRKMVRRHE